jgi:hypothetical protein
LTHVGRATVDQKYAQPQRGVVANAIGECLPDPRLERSRERRQRLAFVGVGKLDPDRAPWPACDLCDRAKQGRYPIRAAAGRLRQIERSSSGERGAQEDGLRFVQRARPIAFADVGDDERGASLNVDARIARDAAQVGAGFGLETGATIGDDCRQAFSG